MVVSFTTADGQERISKYLEGVEWADLVTVQRSGITRDALVSLRRQIVQAAKKRGLNSGSGINYRTGKVQLYTDKVDEWRSRLGIQLTARAEGAAIMSRLEFVKESGNAPADYPYLQPDIGAAQADKPLLEANAIVTFYAEAMKINKDKTKHHLTLQYETGAALHNR